MSDNSSAADDGELIPIREISRATGVNTVTLRAWERRYGLLVPQRTSKGHRLYTQADVQKVKAVQVWLSRGVAISKVKALLGSETETDFDQTMDSAWVSVAAQLDSSITGFNRSRLDHILADTFALYPAEIVADYVLVPMLKNLQNDAPGHAAKRAFFCSVLQEYLHAAIYRQRQAMHGDKIFMVSLSASAVDLEPLILQYSILAHQYPVDCVGYLDVKEALICAEALQPKIIVLAGYGTMTTSELQLYLKAWREKNNVPIVLCGDLALVYPALNLPASNDVHSCVAMQQIHYAINHLLKE